MAVEHMEEVVISGIGGRFPECDNVDELKDLLFNKVNGITIDSRRWKQNEMGAIDGTGKLKNIDKFDAMFFSTHPKLAENMDPLTRIVLETSIEAIIDAGLSPSDLYGSNTAVFTGSSISETEMFSMDSSKNAAFSMLGRSKTMQANRVSYILNLIGPSFTSDGGWICGSNGLEKAKDLIEKGVINSAIVGVTTLVLRPEIQFQHEGLNRLNRSNRTKPFSLDADGYNRSEACIVMFLQRASDAKRSYGTLLSVKSSQFGDHQGYITEHTGEHFKSLLLDSYKEANIDPSTVEFIEAYGSGIKSEDAMELNIMEEVFCTNDRKTPLKVGSVKSNVGHCEVAGLFVSIVKAIIALESGYIPPNINYTEPNDNAPSLKTGKIQVVTEKTPLIGDIIGVSSFGILNAFSHVILKRNKKTKTICTNINDGIPRLILASGRNEENARETVNKIYTYGNDAEFIALTNEVFTKYINAHFYRSFSIYPNPDESRIHNTWNVDLKKRPVWFIFSGMGSQWQGMGTHLMKIPIFANAINKCDSILQPRGVDIKKVLTSQDPKLFDNILYSFVGIAAVQIGLVDVLKALDITPDGILGHSVGELGCAYADGCFTAEEMILSAYSRGRASLETKLIPGMMAAVGLGYCEIKDRIPHDIDIACRNSATSCTISGPVDSIKSFVSKLKSENIFAKAVNVASIAFHSRYIQSAGPTLLKYLKEVIKEPKKRSSKWISSSVPETEWDSDIAKYSSPEYHTNNLLKSVLFEDSLKHIPSDAIVIEIAPHGLLQAIIKSALPETVTNIPLTKKIFGDAVPYLLNAIGKIYASGLNPKIQELYPPVKFPVSRETPSIHSLPFWEHTVQWTPTVAKSASMYGFPGERTTSLLLNDSIHLTEYRINGQHIIPASYILLNVWKMFIEMNAKKMSEEPVQFQNLRFKNNVKIHPTNSSSSYLMIQYGTGLFEYILDDEVICTGQIGFMSVDNLNTHPGRSSDLDQISDDFQWSISKDEIYDLLEKNGYNLGDNFKNISSFNIYKKIIQGHVVWENDWIYFMDSLFKIPLLENIGVGHLEAPVYIRQIWINPTKFEGYLKKDICVDYNTITKEITCDGIKIFDVKNSFIKLTKLKTAVIKLEKQAFVHFNESNSKNIDDFIYDSMDIVMEAEKLNNSTGKLILCSHNNFDDGVTKSCSMLINQILENQLSINFITLNLEIVKNLTEDDELGKFITVTNVTNLEDTMKSLANKNYCYIVVCSKQKLQDVKNWKIISQQKFNDNNYLALIKKEEILDKNSIFIKSTNDNLNLSAWANIQNTGLTYIVKNIEPLEGVGAYVKEILNKNISQKLRFLFILDSNAPDYDSNRSFYTDQLSKGLIVNIYKNGGWGTYKRIAFEELKDGIKVTGDQVLKNFSTDSKTNLTVKYLGLNFKDLVVENDTENEIGPLEYSGFVDNNKTVMGITSFNQLSPKIQYDALLSWPVPSTWSLEEAATVPLTYAMNYYIFNILCTLESDKSILVTSGLHPLGRAAISIGLAEECETYAIVESSLQADQLSNMFPKLSRSRILINTNNKFDVNLKMMTRSKGIDFILNFLSGDAFYAAMRTLACHGKFFNFSKSDMKNHGNMGPNWQKVSRIFRYKNDVIPIKKQHYNVWYLRSNQIIQVNRKSVFHVFPMFSRQAQGTRIFLQNTSFSVVSSNMLINESYHNKQIVQQTFMDGLNKGVIKPFPKCVLTSLSTINSVFDAMRNASITSCKTLLSLKDVTGTPRGNVERDSYQCHPDHVYVLVGNKSDWLSLAEWLVDRGVKKILIAIKRCLMSSPECRRFDRLISRNVSVQIESDVHLKTREESVSWLNRLTSSNVLGSVFIINQADDERINNLRHAFVEHSNKAITAPFVCISSKGAHVCTELKSMGFNAINISWYEVSSQQKNTEKLLISLDTLLKKSNTTKYSSFICSETGTNQSEWSQKMNEILSNYFPGSIDELNTLNDKISKEAEFVEVQTKSPRMSQLKSVTPIFVIPGFKPKLIEKFYMKLLCPTFEAQLPEDICSIDELSNVLVKKLKTITNRGYVTLIGESWGGIVALKMAQILEAQGILVTVTLIEGDPEILTDWAENFQSNDNIINKLKTINSSFSNEVSSHAPNGCIEEIKLLKLTSDTKISQMKTERVLNAIRSRVQALLETKPFLNKLHTKVLIFRYERKFEFYRANLNAYCIENPIVYIIPVKDYKHMMVNKEMIEVIAKSIVYTLPIGVEVSLVDKYKNYHFDVEKILKSIS